MPSVIYVKSHRRGTAAEVVAETADHSVDARASFKTNSQKVRILDRHRAGNVGTISGLLGRNTVLRTASLSADAAGMSEVPDIYIE